MSVNIEDYIPSYLSGTLSIYSILTDVYNNGDMNKILDFCCNICRSYNRNIRQLQNYGTFHPELWL